MILGKVVGEVWATRRHAGLDGRKLLLIQPHLWYEPAFQVAHLVAVDTLGAGVGEDVVICLGEPARHSQLEGETSGPVHGAAAGVPGYAAAAWLPIEAAVMAIVDRVELGEPAGEGRPLRFIGPPPDWARPAPDTAPSPEGDPPKEPQGDQR